MYKRVSNRSIPLTLTAVYLMLFYCYDVRWEQRLKSLNLIVNPSICNTITNNFPKWLRRETQASNKHVREGQREGGLFLPFNLYREQPLALFDLSTCVQLQIFSILFHSQNWWHLLSMFTKLSTYKILLSSIAYNFMVHYCSLGFRSECFDWGLPGTTDENQPLAKSVHLHGLCKWACQNYCLYYIILIIVLFLNK